MGSCAFFALLIIFLALCAAQPLCTFNASPLPDGTVGVDYTAAVGPVDNDHVYYWSSGVLPRPLYVEETGLFGNNPPLANGTYTFYVLATDTSSGTTCQNATKQFSLTINCNSNMAVTATSSASWAATTATDYSEQLKTTGGLLPYTYAKTAGTLPPNMTLSSTGILKGMPTATGTFSFTVTVTDNNGCTSTKVIDFAVTCGVWSLPDSLPDADTSSDYGIVLIASGAVAPIAYTSVTTGSLPPGVSFAQATSKFSGTPTLTGAYGITLTASQDAAGCAPAVGTKTIPINVVCGEFTPNSYTLPDGDTSTAYSGSSTVTGGSGIFAYSAVGLPAGLSITPATGAITGTAQEIGTFNIAVTMSATSPVCSVTYNVSLSIHCGAISVTSGASNFVATGGTAPYTYSTTGTLPTGYSIATDGTVTGTLTAPYSFTVTVTDKNGCKGSRTLSDTVACGSVEITVSPTALEATVGTASSFTFAATMPGKRTIGYTFTMQGTVSGLTLATGSSGVLSGTPLSPGSTEFAITATSTAGCVGVKKFTMQVSCPNTYVDTVKFVDGSIGSAISSQLTHPIAGITPNLFELVSGSLPNGLSLSASGLLSGTPTVVESFEVLVRSSTSGQCPSDQIVRSSITCGTMTMNTTTINTNSSSTLNFALGVNGGTPPYSFEYNCGQLPVPLLTSNGLSFTNGVFAGRPLEQKTHTMEIEATDANLCRFYSSVTVVATCGTYKLTPAVTFPAVPINTAFNHTLQVDGGTNPALTVTNLPTGTSVYTATLALYTGNYLIGGTVTTSGVYTVHVSAAGAGTCPAGSFDITLPICPAAVTLSPDPATNIAADTSTAVSQQFSASGGLAATFTFAATTALPPGLSLSSSGLLSGTPTANGTFTVTIKATDTYGCFNSKVYTIVSACGVITPGTVTLSAAQTATDTTLAPVATITGGTSPYRVVFTGGLPNGMTATAAGASGSPTQTGTFNVAYTVFDTNQCSATGTASLLVTCGGPSFTTTSLAQATVALNYSSDVITVTKAVLPVTLSVVTASQLPPGVTLVGTTLTGVPSQQGVFNFSVSATDNAGCVSTQQFSLTVGLVPPTSTQSTGTQTQTPTQTGTSSTTPTSSQTPTSTSITSDPSNSKKKSSKTVIIIIVVVVVVVVLAGVAGVVGFILWKRNNDESKMNGLHRVPSSPRDTF